MSENSPSINLVKNKQIPFLDKFMNWALTAGRLIVIITEVVAVAAFIYRFSLDEKIIDLHSAIKQKQALVSLLKPDEDKYRNLQERIALASTISEKSIKTNKIVLDIISSVPPGTTINDFIFNKDRINISVSLNSVSSLTDFIEPLKNHPNIKSLSIDAIENKPSLGILVTVSAMLK